MLRMAAVSSSPPQESLINVVKVVLPTCYESNDISIRPPPSCNSCMKCTQCQTNSLELSREHQVIVRLVEQGLVLDPVNKVINTKYPVNELVEDLQDNYHQAVIRESSVKRSLIRTKNLERDHERPSMRGSIEALSRRFRGRKSRHGRPKAIRLTILDISLCTSLPVKLLL